MTTEINTTPQAQITGGEHAPQYAINKPFDQDQHIASGFAPVEDDTPKEISFEDSIGNVRSIASAPSVQQTEPVETKQSNFNIATAPISIETDEDSEKSHNRLALPKERTTALGRFANRVVFGSADPLTGRAHYVDVSKDSVAVQAAKRRQNITAEVEKIRTIKPY